MRGISSWFPLLLTIMTIAFATDSTHGSGAPASAATQECLGCHAVYHPGIVADWLKSRHAATTPATALEVKGPGLKVSSPKVPGELLGTSVGCAECHTLRGEAHADTFEHNGFDIHVVVSPDDCATCHQVEREQYARNIMSAAHANLADNALYSDLERTIMGRGTRREGKLQFWPPDQLSRDEGCFYCHGTKLELTGTQWRDTDAGEMEFPVIKGWPNQGVGRVNLDGSLGSCTSCHPRHHFSMEAARKPYTCKQCHAGPDVPAYKIYSASKHGNLFQAKSDQWRFDSVPWVVGRDFTAPTCAACHISLVVDGDGTVINQRTHQMTDRLGYRLFGLIYAHRQPASPDTTPIRNKSGLPLPTDLDGTPADTFLIGPELVATRRGAMQRNCMACHSASWVERHFKRLDNTIAETNHNVRKATELMELIWKKKYAQGPAEGGSPFDEYIERRWMDTWLIYANSTRLASAMSGGGDYGVFEIGRYQLTSAIMEIDDWFETQEKIRARKK